MKYQKIILAFAVVFLICQMASSKECTTDMDCSDKQCCLEKDGARKCSALSKKGSQCTEPGTELHPDHCPCKSGLTCSESGGMLKCMKM
ncbi:hypothetical protein X975_10257, partial [Stegodyphus mimosarum]